MNHGCVDARLTTSRGMPPDSNHGVAEPSVSAPKSTMSLQMGDFMQTIERIELTADEARQGVTGHNVWFVLLTSLTLTVVMFVTLAVLM
jgi:hypothetical protein